MKKILSIAIVAAMLVGAITGCGAAPATSSPAAGADSSATSGSSADKAPPAGGEVVNVMTGDMTDPDWDAFVAEVKAKTGVTINGIETPTNSDTRQQKITTVLSSGDSSIDIVHLNDEMISAFKNTGWLEPLQGDVMKPEVAATFTAQDYIKDMLTSAQGDILAVPTYRGILAFWVDQKQFDELGIKVPTNKDEFVDACKKLTANGGYGYGGSWEKTYVFNELGTFINLFGGDYYDWTNPANKEALQFMYDMANTWKVTPVSQLADKYEQMEQRFLDGEHAMQLMWGTGQSYDEAGRGGADQIHMAEMPKFTTKSAFSDSWSYAINKAAKNKDAAKKVLSYVASKEGSLKGWELFNRYPAIIEAEADASFSNPIKDMYMTYGETTALRGRPMLPQTMEFITDIGTLFTKYIQNQITVDEFCVQAQKYVETYS